MELIKAINTRRSVRKFSTKEISHKDLKKIINSAIQAPSACDIQGWKFIIITDQNVKDKIVERGGTSFIQNAPLGILVLYENLTDNFEYNDHIQSAAAAIQNMLLTAHSLGIGGCWVCHLPRKQELRNLLQIPKSYDPIAYILLGYSETLPSKKQRKYQFSEVTSYNKFNFREFPRANLKLAIKRIARKAYYLLPIFVRKSLNKRMDDKFERRFE